MDADLEFTRASAETGTPGNLNQLLQELESRATLSALAGSEGGSTAIVTIGSELPSEQDNKRFRVHFLTNREGTALGIAFFSAGKWVSYSFGFQQGAFSHFLDGLAPQGWYKANGERGTINIASSSPTDYDLGGLGQIFLYQYTGVF